MASLGDSASMFGDPRASQFSTMRHNQRVFSDPAIANHSNHATSSRFVTRDDQTCHSVPVTPRKALSQNQISRMPPPPTNNRYSSTLLGNFLRQNSRGLNFKGGDNPTVIQMATKYWSSSWKQLCSHDLNNSQLFKYLIVGPVNVIVLNTGLLIGRNFGLFFKWHLITTLVNLHSLTNSPVFRHNSARSWDIIYRRFSRRCRIGLNYKASLSK